MLESIDKLVISIANIYKHMQTLEAPLIMNKTHKKKLNAKFELNPCPIGPCIQW
jgi:hypothetical protein